MIYTSNSQWGRLFPTESTSLCADVCVVCSVWSYTTWLLIIRSGWQRHTWVWNRHKHDKPPTQNTASVFPSLATCSVCLCHHSWNPSPRSRWKTPLSAERGHNSKGERGVVQEYTRCRGTMNRLRARHFVAFLWRHAWNRAGAANVVVHRDLRSVFKFKMMDC